MNKLARNFAAALLFLSMTAVTLADGQIDIPLTSHSMQCLTCTTSQDQMDTTSQGQTNTPTTTSPADGTTSIRTDTTLAEAGLILFLSFSSIL